MNGLLENYSSFFCVFTAEGRYRVPKCPTQISEKHISRAIVLYLDGLKKEGRLTYYVNLEGGRRDIRQQVSMKQQGARPGRPDLEIFVSDGRVIFVELKRKKGGRLSAAQSQEIEDLRRFGHSCHVIRAVDERDGVGQLEAVLESISIF